MKKTIFRIVTLLVLITIMIIIFSFSSQTGDKSGALSTSISKYILTIFVDNFSELDSLEQLKLIDKVSFFVRKGSHIGEYALLSLAAFLFFKGYFNNKKSLIFGLLLVFLYASTDELHQLFVSDRGGRFTDVLIDTAGGLIMSGLIMLGLSIKNKKKE